MVEIGSRLLSIQSFINRYIFRNTWVMPVAEFWNLLILEVFWTRLDKEQLAIVKFSWSLKILKLPMNVVTRAVGCRSWFQVSFTKLQNILLLFNPIFLCLGYQNFWQSISMPTVVILALSWWHKIIKVNV